MIKFIKSNTLEISGALIVLALGFLSGFIGNAEGSLWFQELLKPSFNPPSWVFGPVWSILYIMIGIVFAKLWKERGKNHFPLIIFTLQMILNLIWSPLFFYYHRIDLALYDITLLVISLAIFLFLSKSKRMIVILTLPYFLWVCFAFALNYSFYMINS